MTTIASTIIQTKFVIYMIAVILVQIMVITIYFTSARKPWQGVETKAEEAEKLQNDRIFEDDIEPYGNSDFT